MSQFYPLTNIFQPVNPPKAEGYHEFVGKKCAILRSVIPRSVIPRSVTLISENLLIKNLQQAGSHVFIVQEMRELLGVQFRKFKEKIQS